MYPSNIPLGTGEQEQDPDEMPLSSGPALFDKIKQSSGTDIQHFTERFNLTP